jgi:sulfate adenylyltransferase subunit 2
MSQMLEAARAGSTARMDHLDWLEAESIHILRELVAECTDPALLFSGGKDSVVVLHLALKAFDTGPGRRTVLPFPLVHIDTGHNYPEVIDFRDRRVAEIGARLVIGHVDDSIARGTVRLRRENDSRNAAQAVTLLETIATHGFDALIGGARRDEEKARAKERIFSFRDEFGQWDPKAQRPELWSLYNTRLTKGEHLRVFPISNWTELDIWQYIAREQLELPSIYFAHPRQIVRRSGLLVPVTPLTPLRAGETPETVQVRFRTVGDISCTCPVASDADDFNKIIAETAVSEITERGATRMDDQTSEAAMEQRKKQGYF